MGTTEYLRQAAIAGQFAPQLLVMTDPQYRILWANKAAERAFAPLDQLIGRPCYKAIEGRDDVCPDCVVARSHASGKREEDELRDVAENGRPMHFLVHAQPILDEDGTPIAWLESTIGLTSIKQLNLERKRLQILLSMQESESRFDSLAQVAPIGIGISVSNRWIWLNELFASTFGYLPQELIDAAPLDLVAPSMREMVAQRFAEILSTKSCTDITELRVTRRDGEERIVSTASTYCVYRGEDAIMSVVRDVTEERRAAAIIERTNQDLKTRNQQLASLNSIATALRQSLDISEVLNIALEEMLAITQAQAGAISLVRPGTGTLQLAAHRNVPDPLHEMLIDARIEDGWEARVISADEVLLIEDLRNDPDTFGLTLECGFLSAICVPLRAHETIVAVLNLLSDEADHFTSVSPEFLSSVGTQIGLAVDNARLFMEKADSEQLYRDLFEAVPDPVVLISLDGARILRCNRPFREQFGYSLADIAELSVEELIVPDDRKRARDEIEALLADDALPAAEFEIRCIDKEGAVRDVLVHTVPYYAQDRLIGFQAIARDITEKKRLESHLLQTEKLSALGQLVSGVAHELNNPLATILLATELLLQEETDPGKRSRLEAIIDQVNRSSTLTEDLRLFARREKPHSELVDVRLLLQRVQGLVAPAFRRENIALVMNLPEEAPPVAGDSHQLEQVALNLMTNALQAMEGKPGDNALTVSVETGTMQRQEGAGAQVPSVRIVFADTGPGVSPQVGNRIFDPFHTSKPPGKGTGLGLSVSLGIAESHNGTLYLRTATQGATFVLELPQAIDSSELREAPDKEKRQGTSQPSDLNGMRVLVVDDEVNIVLLLTAMLRASNCKVDGVSSAADALSKLTSGSYDVILCDIKMPLVQGSPGYAAIVNAYPEIAARMVLMSGDTASLETVQLLESMHGPALRKPFTYNELVSVLETVAANNTGKQKE